MELFNLAYQAILSKQPETKSELISAIGFELEALGHSSASNFIDSSSPVKIPVPGFPSGLELVHPNKLERRSLQTTRGQACLLHAIAHIEFNAINLALDAIYRFRGMPVDFYRDWLLVAEQEADHHQKVSERLGELGYQYCDFPVHNGLWDIACRTSDRLIDRMALVPCVFEARGLDVTPPMIRKLQGAGDPRSAAILEFILQEEIGHVETGIRWFEFACRADGVDPVSTFLELVAEYLPSKPIGPLNVEDRLSAGFTREWLEKLEQLSTPTA